MKIRNLFVGAIPVFIFLVPVGSGQTSQMSIYDVEGVSIRIELPIDWIPNSNTRTDQLAMWLVNTDPAVESIEEARQRVLLSYCKKDPQIEYFGDIGVVRTGATQSLQELSEENAKRMQTFPLSKAHEMNADGAPSIPFKNYASLASTLWNNEKTATHYLYWVVIDGEVVSITITTSNKTDADKIAASIRSR